MKEKIIPRCSRCKKVKRIVDFHKGGLKNGRNCWCKKCVSLFYQLKRKEDPQKFRDRQKQWRMKNLEKSKILSRRSQQKVRLLILKAYGNKCVCCGEREEKFLHLDHVNNDGVKHRKKNNLHGGSALYYYAKRNNYPKNLQLLCANCNLAKGHYGKCPHKS